jgi:hypothetical protein
MKKEATDSYETSINFLQITRRHKPEDKPVLEIHRRETMAWHTEITEQAIR